MRHMTDPSSAVRALLMEYKAAQAAYAAFTGDAGRAWLVKGEAGEPPTGFIELADGSPRQSFDDLAAWQAAVEKAGITTPDDAAAEPAPDPAIPAPAAPPAAKPDPVAPDPVKPPPGDPAAATANDTPVGENPDSLLPDAATADEDVTPPGDAPGRYDTAWADKVKGADDTVKPGDTLARDGMDGLNQFIGDLFADPDKATDTTTPPAADDTGVPPAGTTMTDREMLR